MYKKVEFFKLINGMVAAIFFITSSVSAAPFTSTASLTSTLRPNSSANKVIWTGPAKKASADGLMDAKDTERTNRLTTLLKEGLSASSKSASGKDRRMEEAERGFSAIYDSGLEDTKVKRDVVILSMRAATANAIEAAEELAKLGISCRVIDITQIEKMVSSQENINELARLLRDCRYLITVAGVKTAILEEKLAKVIVRSGLLSHFIDIAHLDIRDSSESEAPQELNEKHDFDTRGILIRALQMYTSYQPTGGEIDLSAPQRVDKKQKQAEILLRKLIASQRKAFMDGLSHSFDISAEEMLKIISEFEGEMSRGLTGKASSLKMLSAFINNPTGKEKGIYMGIDLGGENLRFVIVQLLGNGIYKVLYERKKEMKPEQFSREDEIFDAIAVFIKEGLEEVQAKQHISSAKPLNYKAGFTFSFPVKQTGIAKGKIVELTKGWGERFPQLIGQDPVALLQEALSRNNVDNVDIVALCNDTVGTLVTRAYQDLLCIIGAILGTGTNIAAVIDGMIRNLESGGFNKLRMTEFDKELDVISANPGRQILEKQVSGKYLPEVVRPILCDLIRRGLLFDGRMGPELVKFSNPYSLKTKYMSEVERDQSSNLIGVKALLENEFGIKGSTIEDRRIIKQVCELVSGRGAKIFAPALAAALFKALLRIDPSLSKPHTLAIDGSVYEFHPTYAKNMNEAFKVICKERFGDARKAENIRVKLTKDGSCIGPAIIAAIVDTDGEIKETKSVAAGEDKAIEQIKQRISNVLGAISHMHYFSEMQRTFDSKDRRTLNSYKVITDYLEAKIGFLRTEIGKYTHRENEALLEAISRLQSISKITNQLVVGNLSVVDGVITIRPCLIKDYPGETVTMQVTRYGRTTKVTGVVKSNSTPWYVHLDKGSYSVEEEIDACWLGSEAPTGKSSSAGYAKAVAEEIALFSQTLFPNRRKSECEHIVVEYIINTLNILKLIDDIAKASGTNYAVVKRQLKEYPMLKDTIDKYGARQDIPVPTRPNSPALELMVLIARIATQLKLDIQKITKIFLNCVEPTEFVDRLHHYGELQFLSHQEIANQLQGYPTLGIIWSNYFDELQLETGDSGPRTSSAGRTILVNGIAFEAEALTTDRIEKLQREAKTIGRIAITDSVIQELFKDIKLTGHLYITGRDETCLVFKKAEEEGLPDIPVLVWLDGDIRLKVFTLNLTIAKLKELKTVFSGNDAAQELLQRNIELLGEQSTKSSSAGGRLENVIRGDLKEIKNKLKKEIKVCLERKDFAEVASVINGLFKKNADIGSRAWLVQGMGIDLLKIRLRYNRANMDAVFETIKKTKPQGMEFINSEAFSRLPSGVQFQIASWYKLRPSVRTKSKASAAEATGVTEATSAYKKLLIKLIKTQRSLKRVIDIVEEARDKVAVLIDYETAVREYTPAEIPAYSIQGKVLFVSIWVKENKKSKLRSIHLNFKTIGGITMPLEGIPVFLVKAGTKRKAAETKIVQTSPTTAKAVFENVPHKDFIFNVGKPNLRNLKQLYAELDRKAKTATPKSSSAGTVDDDDQELMMGWRAARRHEEAMRKINEDRAEIERIGPEAHRRAEGLRNRIKRIIMNSTAVGGLVPEDQATITTLQERLERILNPSKSSSAGQIQVGRHTIPISTKSGDYFIAGTLPEELSKVMVFLESLDDTDKGKTLIPGYKLDLKGLRRLDLRSINLAGRIANSNTTESLLNMLDPRTLTYLGRTNKGLTRNSRIYAIKETAKIDVWWILATRNDSQIEALREVAGARSLYANRIGRVDGIPPFAKSSSAGEVSQDDLELGKTMVTRWGNMPLELIAKMRGSNRNWYLGINSSTQSVTFTVCDFDTKEIIFQWQEKYKDEFYKDFNASDGSLPHPDKNRHHTNPLMLATALDKGMKELSDAFKTFEWDIKNIRAISGAGQQHGTVYYNKEAAGILNSLDPARPLAEQIKEALAWEEAPIWRDKTTESQQIEAEEFFGGPEALRQKTGSRGELRFGLLQIMKLYEDDKATYDKTATIVNIAGFNGGLLSGIAGFPFDYGDGAGANAMDIRTNQWLPEIDELVPGLRAKLPDIKPTNYIVGNISRYWTKYGFSPDIKIVNWTGDNPSAMVGQGIIGKGQVGISLGTSFTIYTYIDEAELEKTLQSKIGNVFKEPTGKWMKLVCFQNGALALEEIRDKWVSRLEAIMWLGEQGIDRMQFANEDDWEKRIDSMRWQIFNEKVLEAPVGNDGAMMITQNTREEAVRIPYIEGKPFTRNLDLETAGCAKTLRAAVEGQIYFLKWVADQIGLDVKEINLTGGSSKNPVIRQIIADIFNAKVNVLKKSYFPNEPVSLGAAINAAKAYTDSVKEEVMPWEQAIKDLVALDSKMTTSPNENNVAIYRQYYPEFDKLVKEAMASKASAAGAFTDVAADITEKDKGRIAELKSFFSQRFGYYPDIITLAPGRDNAQGEHVDYPEVQFQGDTPAHLYSMGAALQLNYLMAIGRRTDDAVHIAYMGEERVASFKLSELDKLQKIAIEERENRVPAEKRQLPSWVNHTLGVLMQARERGLPLSGMDIVLTSDVPYGAGLSNSAANCCAVTIGLNDLYSWKLTKNEIVALARSGEHDRFVGGKCGWLDQLISINSKKGYFTMIDYADKSTGHFKSNLPATLQRVLIDTKVPRELAETEYNDRVKELELAFEILGKALNQKINSTSFTLAELNYLIGILNPSIPAVDLKEAGLENAMSEGEKQNQNSMDLSELYEILPILSAIDRDYQIPGLKRHKGITDKRESFAILLRRMRHQLTSHLRTPLTGETAEKGYIETFGELIDTEGRSLRMSGDFQITGDNGAQDALLDIGFKIGKALGITVFGRMEGGGGGGNVGFYVDRTDGNLYKEWKKQVTAEYEKWVESQPALRAKGIKPSILEPELSSGAAVVYTAKASSAGEMLLNIDDLASLTPENLEHDIAMAEGDLLKVLTDSKLTAELFKLGPGGTIAINEADIPENQKEVVAKIYKEDSPLIRELERLTGCVIRLVSQLKPEHIKGELVIISNGVVSGYENARYLSLKNSIPLVTNSYLTLVPLIGVAKVLLGPKDLDYIKNALNTNDFYHKVFGQNLTDEIIQNYLNTGFFNLPVPRFDYDKLEMLQRQALAALIAA